MSKVLPFELPDEVYASLQRLASGSGRQVEELALEWLARHGPKPRPRWRQEELTAAWARLRSHAGAANSGDPCSADNERLDADLARDYGDTHEEGR